MGQKVRALVVERLRANEKVLGRWQEVSNVNPHTPLSCTTTRVFSGVGTGSGVGCMSGYISPSPSRAGRQGPERSTLRLVPGK